MDLILAWFSPDPNSIVYKIRTVEGCGYSRERGGGGTPPVGSTHTWNPHVFQTGTKKEIFMKYTCKCKIPDKSLMEM